MFPCATLEGERQKMFTFSVSYPEMKKDNKCLKIQNKKNPCFDSFK